MEHNLQQLQDCFVSLHSHVKVQVKNLELDLLWWYPVGRGILKERVSLARRSANILVNRGCLTGRCFIAPRTIFETWGHFWCRMEQAGAQGLAGNEHGRNKAGFLLYVSSSRVSLPSLRYGLAPERGPACCSSFCELKRHSEHPKLPLATWDEEACHLLGKRRASWQCFGSSWRWNHALLLSRSAGLQRGECAAARGWVAAAGTLQGLWHSGTGLFFAFGTQISLTVGGFNLCFLSHAQILPLSSLG